MQHTTRITTPLTGYQARCCDDARWDGLDSCVRPSRALCEHQDSSRASSRISLHSASASPPSGLPPSIRSDCGTCVRCARPTLPHRTISGAPQQLYPCTNMGGEAHEHGVPINAQSESLGCLWGGACTH
eukprot:1248693-Prymnesium_polylepis.3